MSPGNAAFDRLLLAGAALLAFLLLGPVLAIPLHIPINYNEGWNAYLGMRAVIPGTGPLYPPAGSFVFNNYPPLSFYVVGALGRFVVGDMIVAGRIVSLLSLLASGVLLGACVRRLGGSLRASLAASLLLLLYAGSFYRDYVAMDDPQWLAHALMLAGLAVLLRSRSVHRLPAADVIGAALLMLAGGFVKHSLVGLPLAVTLWLGCLNRRAALVWLLAAGIGLGLGLAATDALHGHAAFADILQHRRIFLPRRMTKAIGRLLPLVPMAAVAAVVLGRLKRRTPGVLLAFLFIAVATVVGVVQRLGEGVYYNAHFETMIAVCLASGLALSSVPGTTPRLRGRAPGPVSLAVVAALPFLATLPWHLTRAWRDIHDASAREAAWRPVIARIVAAPGPGGCEMLSLCYWAGKPYAVDMFNFTQSVLVGSPVDRFQAMVDRHGFGIFQYTPHSFIHQDADRQLGHDPVMDAFSGTYAPVAAGPQGSVLLAFLFVAVATVVGVVQRLGEGVYYNAHFETMIAVCLASGLALSSVPGTTPRPRGRAPGPVSLAVVAALPLLATLPWHLTRAWRDIHDASAREAAWRPVIARIAAAPGPAGCEMLSLCYWAGKPYEVDMFNFTQSVLAGGPVDRFQAMVDRHGFAIFQYTPHSFIHEDADRQLGHDPVMDAFSGVYAPVAAGPQGSVLLAPR